MRGAWCVVRVAEEEIVSVGEKEDLISLSFPRASSFTGIVREKIQNGNNVFPDCPGSQTIK